MATSFLLNSRSKRQQEDREKQSSFSWTQEGTGTVNHTTITEVILLGLTNHRRTQIAFFVLILFAYGITMLSNLLIIMLVRSDSRLHTPMYLFLSNLSGLEMCYISSIVPQMLAHMLSGSGRISFNSCMVQMYMTCSLGCTEGLLLGAMAYDRYLAICCPLVYPMAMSRERCVALTIASWAGAFLFSGIITACILHLPFCGPNHINHFLCEFIMVIQLACTNTHFAELSVFVLGIFTVFIPFCVILTSYGVILLSVTRMSSGVARNKAFSTCTSHLTVVIIFYGSIIGIYVRPQPGTDHGNDKLGSFFNVVFTPLLNPVIYTLRNKDVHAALTKVLRGRAAGHITGL
ncbi:olfactory receptor 2D2-like [Tiliqua scincoides]|uniref:olfactory receptor 2D2-like n=1 Tax=Tiliqua scincoides TaxID=71010 RepID=UPI0034636F83